MLETTKEKIRNSKYHKNLKGKKNPFYGKLHSKETKDKISRANKNRKISLQERKIRQAAAIKMWQNPEHRKKVKLIHTEKTKKLIGKFSKERWSNKKFYHIMVNKIRKRMKSKEFRKKLFTRKNKTSLEILTEKVIKKLNLPYKFSGNGDIWIGNSNPDFININGQKILIEVYHDFFKIDQYGSINRYKRLKRYNYKKYGYKVYFFDAKQIKSKNFEQRLFKVLK